MRNKAIGLLATAMMVLTACGGSGGEQGGGVEVAIGVHGAWTIDVLNADGSLDQHLAFENAFTGAWATVSSLVTHRDSGFVVQADSAPAGNGPCDDVTARPGLCSLSESDATLTATALPGSSADNITPTNDEVSLVLDGQFTAAQSGDISVVNAIVAYPIGLDAQPFSERTLDAPIAVAAGQVVQIEVTYTFGSA